MLYNALIVEDDRQAAQGLAAQLSVLGHTVAIAYGPRMAIQQLNQVIPDIIFMDINMPGVDGLEVLRFLRRDPVTAKVPVVIVSANDTDDIKKMALDAGANGYLVKPPMIEDIEATLLSVITVPPPTTTAPASDAAAAPAPDVTVKP
jgi:CheY-like chemotaxis protein